MAASEQLAIDFDEIADGRLSALDDLPRGWIVKTLGEVAPINMGQSPPGASYNDAGEGVPLLNGPTEFGRHHPLAVQWTMAPSKLCRPGDILLCVRGATTGRMNWADREYCIGRGLAALTPNTSVCMPEYIYYFIRTQTQAMLSLAAGSTFPNLAGAKLKTLRIPLPPLPEQRRIVARIEELVARIERARELRRESSSVVSMVMPKALETMHEDMLSSDYPRGKIGQYSHVTSGGTPSRKEPAYWGGSISWVKTGELLDEDICETEEHITQQAVDNSSAKLFPPETVLIALYGQGQTRGRTGRLMIEATTNQACCAILPAPSRLESRFLQYWLRSLYGEIRQLSQGGTQPNLNGEMIKGIEIVIPPLDKQQGIVADLDAIRGKADQLRELQAESAAELDALLPAVLAQAFRGEL